MGTWDDAERQRIAQQIHTIDAVILLVREFHEFWGRWPTAEEIAKLLHAS